MAGQIITGVKPVGEALRSGRAVNRVYVAKESRAHGVQELIDLAKGQGVPFDFVPQAKLNSLAHSQEHQGVAAAVSPVEYASLDDFLAACPAPATVLALDQVQHPKNLGMLIRTAVGAGAAGLLLSSRGGALLDESVVRASAGAVFHLPVMHERKLPAALRELKKAGFWVYGLEAGGAESVFTAAWAERSVLVLGNETSGMRGPVSNACDALVSIPLARGLDSLNVATAAAVALFQAAHAQGRL